MKHIGFVKADTMVSIMNWVGLPLFVVYILSMLVVPCLTGNWVYVQEVWDRWQTLNVGVLAFISSVIAFNIAKYNANKQRERQFIAARAFMPHALSELTSYCKQSAILLREAWEKLRETETRPGPLSLELPELPESYKEIFSRCISDADPDVADYLANILVKLQVHHSRMKELKSAFGKNEGMIFVPHNVMTYIFSLGELQALINRFFGFARGMEPFNDSNIVWEDYRNAYSNLDIDAEDVDDLVGFTQRAISRKA